MELTTVEVGQLMQLPDDRAPISVTNAICVPMLRHLEERKLVTLTDSPAPEPVIFDAALTQAGQQALSDNRDEPWRGEG
jgi:hypothetical protein